MMIFYRLVDVLGAYLDKAAKLTESTLDDQLVPMVRKALKIFIIIITITAARTPKAFVTRDTAVCFILS